MKNNGVHFEIGDYPWTIFGTFTLRAANESRDDYTKRARAMLAEFSNDYGVKPVHAITRVERGGQGGRTHLHILIGKLPLFNGNIRRMSCRLLKYAWYNFGGGIARVYPFNPDMDGVGYVLKDLDEMWKAGSAYELDRFNAATSEVILSESFAAFLIERARTRRLDSVAGSCNTANPQAVKA